MPNHTSNSPDNLYLRGHASLRTKRPKLYGTLALLAASPLLAVFLLLLWLGGWQLPRDAAVQADQAGEELVRQLATQVAEPLAANDTLSMNIILAQWAQNPLVAHASLTAANQRIVAEAGRKLPTDKLAPGKGVFSAMVHIQDEQIGKLHLSLARAPFMAPAVAVLQTLFWTLGLLALAACFIAWRVAVSMRRVLTGIGEWYGDQGVSAPGVHRSDELGDLARRLNERRITDLPPPEPAPIETANIEPEPELELPPTITTATDSEIEPNETTTPIPAETEVVPENFTEHAEGEPVTDDDGDGDGTVEQPQSLPEQEAESNQPPAPASAVLAVRLGDQQQLRNLPRARLLNILERYREHLEQASRTCGGELHTLLDGTSLVFFHSPHDDQLGSALGCGELLRVLGDELQMAVADTGIAPYLQLALCQTVCAGINPEDLPAQSPEYAQMLERMQHSRNLLLLDVELATSELLQSKVMVRRLASQPGSYCVERLRQPYHTRLEQQVASINSQKDQ